MSFHWYGFALAFLVPFVDPRKPLRLLHIDLLVLLVFAFGPLHTYVAYTQPSGSLVLSVLGLAYLAARLLYAGVRPRRSAEPLVPLLPVAALAVLLVVVVGLRYSWVLTDRQVSDVGVVSVLGADRIGQGKDLYDGRIDKYFWHGDTYGPVTYLAYVPFEQIFPWTHGNDARGDQLDAPAARSATMTFDLLIILALFLLGRRLKPGAAGRLLGLALAFAWASYPYSLLVLRYNLNDGVVPLLVLAAVLAIPYAAGRGALAALAGATKFAPLVLAPLLAAGTGERRQRSMLIFALAFLLVSLAVYVPMIPDGGLSELYDRTLGFQQDRHGWNSIWARFPELDLLQRLAQAGVVGLALLAAWVPRRRSLAQVVALAGGLLAALALTMTYWFSGYTVWFAPLAFAALFAAHDCGEGEP